ncbi:hypothetical protein [Methylocaldum sp. 14B]|nr:hypothetical protein [Methylocaldum sp. 14B]
MRDLIAQRPRVVVDAKREQARRYDERFEFERFPDASLTLWSPMAAIAKL